MGNLGHGGAQNKDTFNSAIYLICKIDFKLWAINCNDMYRNTV